MKQTARNTNLRNPEASILDKLEVGLYYSSADSLNSTANYDVEYGELGTAMSEYRRQSFMHRNKSIKCQNN